MMFELYTTLDSCLFDLGVERVGKDNSLSQTAMPGQVKITYAIVEEY